MSLATGAFRSTGMPRDLRGCLERGVWCVCVVCCVAWCGSVLGLCGVCGVCGVVNVRCVVCGACVVWCVVALCFVVLQHTERVTAQTNK